MKVFVISLHRCGTQSTDLFMKNSGLNTCHWPAIINGIDYEGKIIGLEHDPDAVIDVLRPALDQFDAVSDVPIPALYRQLNEMYPEAKFIAIYRDIEKWILSVRNHCENRDFQPYERVLYWRYFEHHPQSLSELTDDQLKSMFNRHYNEIIKYFIAQDNLFLGYLTDPKISYKLSKFLAIPEAEFPHVDYRRELINVSSKTTNK